MEAIEAQITPPAEGVPVDDEDTILTNIAAPFDALLYFLWACHKFPTEIASPPMQPIDDTEALSWEKTTREVVLQTKKNAVVDLSGAHIAGMTNGAITAMTKLSASMIAHQAASLKKQEEKDNSTLKA